MQGRPFSPKGAALLLALLLALVLVLVLALETTLQEVETEA